MATFAAGLALGCLVLAAAVAGRVLLNIRTGVAWDCVVGGGIASIASGATGVFAAGRTSVRPDAGRTLRLLAGLAVLPIGWGVFPLLASTHAARIRGGRETRLEWPLLRTTVFLLAMLGSAGAAMEFGYWGLFSLGEPIDAVDLTFLAPYAAIASLGLAAASQIARSASRTALLAISAGEAAILYPPVSPINVFPAAALLLAAGGVAILTSLVPTLVELHSPLGAASQPALLIAIVGCAGGVAELSAFAPDLLTPPLAARDVIRVLVTGAAVVFGLVGAGQIYRRPLIATLYEIAAGSLLLAMPIIEGWLSELSTAFLLAAASLSVGSWFGRRQWPFDRGVTG